MLPGLNLRGTCYDDNNRVTQIDTRGKKQKGDMKRYVKKKKTIKEQRKHNLKKDTRKGQ